MYLNKKAFTLFELMVAMSIVISIMLMSYLPYSHYQNKAKLKLSSREISQSFYDAKNMAVSWIRDVDWNKSIWLYLTKDNINNDKLIFFSYPHDIDETSINNEELWDIKIIKTRELQDGIKLNYLWWYDNLLFFFNSINWESKIYTFWASWKIEITDNEISLIFSYKNATSWSLRKELIYFKNTNIIDYN